MAFSANLQRVTITLPVKSGIPRDAVQMDLHYTRPATVTDTDYDNARDHIKDFFNTIASGGGSSLGSFLGDELSSAALAAELRFYDVPTGGGALGSPVATRFFTFAGGASTTMPEEVAVCLSWRTDYGAAVEFGPGTRPRARLRNRMFLGPMAVASKVQDGVTKRVSVAPAVAQAALASAIEFLYTDMFADEWLWRVVSPTANLDHPVTFVEMDDAFDTQRRRGPRPTVRTEASVV